MFTHSNKLKLRESSKRQQYLTVLRWFVPRPRQHWAKRTLTGLGVLLIIVTAIMSSISAWYRHSQSNQAYEYGVSFVPDYASSLGVDPMQTMDGLTNIGIKHFRLVSYWSDIEQTPGSYDFSQLDWQFKKAEAAHATVSLALGLRQPRWPECHMPDWASKEPVSQWQPQLESFMQAVVQRYKDSPSLQSYQLENEYFLQGFGVCTNFSRDRLISEYNLVKKTDPIHKVIISRSNNGIGIPVNEPKPDEYGISIYKRVWDAGFSHRYLEYPFASWYYGFLAGLQKIHDGNNMIIHEMQAEAWAPNGKQVVDTSLAEQNKSLDAKRLAHRFNFAQGTGMHEVYMWGGEYWWYRKQVLHDDSLWKTAQAEYKNYQ